MSVNNDGGSAFPTPSRCNPQGLVEYSDGMNLRDWFAGQALAGLLGNADYKLHAEAGEDIPKLIAAQVYEMADAMLKARGGAS
jgi:hypothetical protein